jgi:hypothetical protein
MSNFSHCLKSIKEKVDIWVSKRHISRDAHLLEIENVVVALIQKMNKESLPIKIWWKSSSWKLSAQSCCWIERRNGK